MAPAFDWYETFDITFTPSCDVTVKFTPKQGVNSRWPEAGTVTSTSGWFVPDVDPGNALLGGTVVLQFQAADGSTGSTVQVMPLLPDGELLVELPVQDSIAASLAAAGEAGGSGGSAGTAAAAATASAAAAAAEEVLHASDFAGARSCSAMQPVLGWPRTKHMAGEINHKPAEAVFE